MITDHRQRHHVEVREEYESCANTPCPCPSAGLVDTLLLGCATPTAEGSCELRFSFVVRSTGDADGTARLGEAFIEEIHQRTAEDVEMWETKAYVPRPALAHGDGPIMQYRRWCEQFYAEGVDRSKAPWEPEKVPT